jgi:hypothetical protein
MAELGRIAGNTEDSDRLRREQRGQVPHGAS